MEQIVRPNKGQSACTVNRRLVSRIIVIVNVTTILINLARQAEASSLKSHQALRNQANHSPSQPPRVATTHPISQLPGGTGGRQLGEGDHLAGGSGNHEASSESNLKLANNLETNALIYLQRYGYMQAHSDEGSNNLISEDSFSNAISSFQKFAGIPETGIVDEQTRLYMQLPRCGNVDKPQIGQSSSTTATLTTTTTTSHQPPLAKLIGASPSSGGIIRQKRYALQGSKWRRQELTYRISQYPTRFNVKRHEVDSQIEKAFGIWSQVAPIDFVIKKEGRVHIDIRFASGDHGDGDAFDGPGNTLAHAYFPQYGGDAHFDDQEYWTIDSYAGTNIFQVAAHELGHSLGLGHSNVREALMAPFYQKYKPNFKLHLDDVLAIQALYGEKPFLLEVPQQQSPATSTSLASPAPSPSPSSTTTTTTSTTTTTAMPPTTNVAVVAANTTQLPPTMGQFPFYVNKNNRRGGQKPPVDGRETNDDENSQLPDLPGLAGNGLGPNGGGGGGGASDDGLNSAGSSSYPTGGGASYPADLCSDPSIDAITRTEDGSSYVFKGEFYWLLTNEGLAKGYPRRISTDWDGLPGQLDAALTWADGKTFFFKGNKYWRFRNKHRNVGYPKLISAGFAGIPDDIDAAFVWSGNGRTYIFKGSDYWRFDSKADPPVSNEYPRSIKVWSGVPAHLNAAFKWDNNVTYFFKGSQYYRFNDKEFKVEARGRPSFPRPSAEWWFGCVSSNLAQKALPSNLREGSSSGVSHTSAVGPDMGQNIDWSFYAGLSEENTRIMGTHISDHKPPPPPPPPAMSPPAGNDNGYNRRNGAPDDDEPHDRPSYQNNHHRTNMMNDYGPRIGFHHPSLAKTKEVSSSAITLSLESAILSATLISTTVGCFMELYHFGVTLKYPAFRL